MFRQLITYIIFFSLIGSVSAIQIDQTSATALNTVTLYQDSTFIQHTDFQYKEGTFFKIIDESYYEHPDADQKQKFKWYKVETNDKQIGWVFGDGLAVFVPHQDVDPILKPFHQQRVSLGNGFDNAVSWVGAIYGRDNFHAQDYMNPLYNEYYLVVTNKRGNSVLMKCSGESVRGETFAQKVETKDITGDGFPEYIVQRRTSNVGSNLDEREVEIFTMKAGTLSSIFLEHMTLSYESDVPSPALYKQIEIEEKSIRVSYVDYVLPNRYSQDHHLGPQYPRKERCVEYVTAYYTWDKRTKMFKNLYGESRMAPEAGLWGKSSYSIKEKPQVSSRTISSARPNEAITIIKHYEEYVVEGGKKLIKNWFYVRTADGKYGYIPATKVGLMNLEHADILNTYYMNPPISKLDWKANGDDFLILNLP